MDEVVAYLDRFPAEVRARLEALRAMVRERCPLAVESVSYGLIGYKLGGRPLIYLGGFKNHIGLYATPVGHEAFAAEFAAYKQGKGSVQFPLSEPLPTDLIARVIAHRVEAVSEELPAIGRPATGALAEIGVTRAGQLADYSEKELLALHGVGQKAIRLLREAGVRLRDD
ncbi:DUF1801 domain-containing protein [Leucobacter soli]|uniref:YdhG-like domain-containing protein n=1 Tax=Leucobacter soli TaxID=2812850 RepID=A0A916NI78_9MICO|nr:DUF1801 domain-containing protein [Leucobacter soli]CAG7614770.1 hypothetical protein LEUCIP111803_01816 [Leucobacter soli]